MACRECWNMFAGRCENCGRIRCRDGIEKNELEEVEE